MTGTQVHAPAAPAPPLPPGTRPVPGYVLLAHLTRTGWLDLYDSWSEERDCRCVVKVVRPDRRGEPDLTERLLREGRWLLDFTHPHLVRAYEFFVEPEPLVVLETLSGETLSHLVHRLKRRPAATDVAVLGAQMCSAAHYLHGQGLLHLDLKPANIVVERGHVKVLDLSLARPPGLAPPGIGTFAYLAPEQARGEPLTAATDVWGIGVTLYETACGSLPFLPPGDHCASSYGYGYGSGFEDERYPQLEETAPPVTARRRLPRELAALIDGCLRAKPRERPTVPDLATALRALFPAPETRE